MAEYRIRKTGEIVTKLATTFPNVSLPVALTQDDFDVLGIDPVFQAPEPTISQFQTAYRDGVEQIGGKWYTKYSVADMDDEAKAAVDDAIRSANRDTRNRKLTECDWTQLGDVRLTAQCKADFADYRQALRDIDLLDPVWPDEPQEEWVS